MQTPIRLGALLGLSGLALFAAASPAQAAASADSTQNADATQVVARWADDVWDAARDGDSARLESTFERVPAAEVPAGSADRFKSALAQLRTNRERAVESQSTRRVEAIGEMRDELEKTNLSSALRKAVEAQTLSDDLDDAFENEEIMKIVAWAEQEIPVVEQQRQWLDAQEILYLLRTFYDETTRQDEFARYDEELELVNHRVALLARYVPRKLHDMRSERALRLGEEPLGEYNPAIAVDWRERLVGVDQKMLKTALGLAANEHIEALGWRPLLKGGLESLQLLASTSALAETFPGLGDAARVNAWTTHIDSQLELLERTADADLDKWTLTVMLDDLAERNRQTIDVPLEVLLREFGDGATDALDTYSEIIWPEKLRRFKQATDGNFVGVGILIRHNDKREILVVNPLEGTPAYFAGVKPNDLIATVDGDSTVGWSLNDAVDRITGPKGTSVRVGLKREGVDELVEVEIVRDIIKIRSLKGWWKKGLTEEGEPVWDWYIDPHDRIVYMRLAQFTEDSFHDIREAWEQICAEAEPRGFILDLRHNPGGLLTSAVKISNLFVNDGSIVSGENKEGEQEWVQKAQPNRSQICLEEVPTVVLINRGSASASEIVAGCLQAHASALVIGERSFGKGSVQTVHHVGADARLKLTTQYYRLPSPDGVQPGRLVHKRAGSLEWGVDPDIEVPMSVQQVTDAINLRQEAEIIPLDDEGNLQPDDPERANVNDLIAKGIDPQLETALLILQARALAGDGADAPAKDAENPIRQAGRPDGARG